MKEVVYLSNNRVLTKGGGRHVTREGYKKIISETDSR